MESELVQTLCNGGLWIMQTIFSEVIGFFVGGILGGIVGYNIKVQKVVRQEQEAGNDSKQQQEYESDNEVEDGNYESNLRQTQRAGNNSFQIQRGRENRK